MQSGGWIPLDKSLVSFLPKDRPYTILEAMFSYSKDVDENNENSINGYARIWSWSRCKVRRFITDCKTVARHAPDRDETGARHEVRYIFKDLEDRKDNGKTPIRQRRDSGKTITTNPNPNTYKNTYAEDVTMTSEEYQKLVNSHGEEKTIWMINKLSSYKGSKGKKYASDYKAILTWVVEDADKHFIPKVKMKTIMNHDGQIIEVPE